jgi:hypothetical protein
VLPIARIIDQIVAVFDRTLPGISSNGLVCAHSESSPTAGAGVVGDAIASDGFFRNNGISIAGAVVAFHLLTVRNSLPPN